MMMITSAILCADMQPSNACGMFRFLVSLCGIYEIPLPVEYTLFLPMQKKIWRLSEYQNRSFYLMWSKIM